MKINLVCKNCAANDKLKEITSQKVTKLDKYFGKEEGEAKITLKKEGNSFVTEIMLEYGGKFVRATASGDNFYDNLDVVLPKIEGQIRKHRTRFDKSHKVSAYGENSLFDTDGKWERKGGEIVKEKGFKLTPMTVNEAIEEMELLDHSFYLFSDLKTGNVKLLYRRNDGDLGLIEPIY